jgi:hypothetical protein
MLKTDRAEDISVLAVAATVPISGRFDGECHCRNLADLCLTCASMLILPSTTRQ